MSPRPVHYVLSTHWDREWYEPFQYFRYRLARLIDRLLEGWQSKQLHGPFQTDGQAILLEDYLEVHPEKTREIQQLVKDGYFKVGPWYILPDELLVSGESLIRNIQLGRKLARQWGGEPSNAGFLCDMFGHNSQMPQIFAGFGIRGAFVWRGINFFEKRHFIWESPDGTQMPAYRFGKVGYCSYAAQVRQAQNPYRITTEEELSRRLEAYLNEEAALTDVGPILAFDGGDHMEWDPIAYQVLSERMSKVDDQFTIHHTTLDDYLDVVLPELSKIKTTIKGELREPGRYIGSIDEQWLIAGVGSSRVWIKQMNADCETALCLWAEPINTLARVVIEQPYPEGFLDVAWKWLLQNHPHDSICGCSIDAVHADMAYRFHQSRQISERLTIEATRKIAASVSGEVKDGETRLVVFNPLPRPIDQSVELTLELPHHYPVCHTEMSGMDFPLAFHLNDVEGHELPYQLLSQINDRKRVRTFDNIFPQEYRVNEVKVAFPLKLPSLGYSTFTIQAGTPGMPTNHLHTQPIASLDHSMVNEKLGVKIDPYGTIDLMDLHKGLVYNNLLTFEDCGDVGDGWNFGPVIADQVFLSSAAKTDVALVHNGPYQATYRLRNVMEVPVEYDYAANTRCATLTSLVIDSRVTLRAGADWIEVETTVHNNVKDHRLRVLFPSGATNAKTYLADSPFDVVERFIALRPDNYLYREAEVEYKPQQSWTAVFDEERGLAIISPGLYESAVLDQPQRPIALTLFRSTRRTVNTNGEPDGQLQGPLTFRYWIVPLHGDPDRSRMFELAQRFSAGLRAVSFPIREMIEQYRQKQSLPPATGFLHIDGQVVMTSLRQTDQDVEVRLFNPNITPVGASLIFSKEFLRGKTPNSIQPVNFEGKSTGEELPVVHGKVEFTVQPKAIVTFRIS